MANIKVSYGKCHIQVSGMDLECPFCKVLVKSGTSHECRPMSIEQKIARPRKRKS